MRPGRFFSLPERPADVDRLRLEAQRLDAATRPRWLDEGHEEEYRLVARSAEARSSGAERKEFEAEVAALEAAGLVVEKDVTSGVTLVYVRVEPDYPLFSIGMYAGIDRKSVV